MLIQHDCVSAAMSRTVVFMKDTTQVGVTVAGESVKLQQRLFDGMNRVPVYDCISCGGSEESSCNIGYHADVDQE